MEKRDLNKLEKNEQSRLLAQHIQNYLARGNCITEVPNGMTGEETKHNGFTRRTFRKG